MGSIKNGSITLDHTLPSHPILESKQTPAATSTKNLFSLAQRTVIVTGSGRGLGITLAQACLEAGADVACIDILPEPSATEWKALNKTAADEDLRIKYYRCDITDEEALAKVIAEVADSAKERSKPFQGLVACAGIQQMIPALEYPIDGFRKILEVNVGGAFLTAKHSARVFVEQKLPGSIVFIASMSGQIANRGLTCTAYNSSKAAVQQMCRSVAQEWGQYGIRVNTLSPGYIRTAMTDQLLEEKPEVEKTWMAGALLGRLGAPEDFKGPTVFLLGDGSAWMTGADLRVDGGHCASA
ncbi:MAG: hypothetical protein M1834_005656 [Cirrosporium novae-zelandiae]|nr:MAG: hypothetical protein M1834_005656 [Cirrosporium novae-zelandiae]